MTERVAIVTGASRGIGQAVALMLASHGVRVLAVGRDEERLQKLAAEAGIEPLAVDLCSRGGCEHAVAEARRRLGPVAILVNNAGRGGFHDQPIWEQDRSGWDETLAINLTAPFELTRLAVHDMRDAGWGRIVMVSSTAGVIGAPALGPYCASKHGAIGLARSIAHDVAAYAITCNAVLPGWVRTEMAEGDARKEAAERSISVEDVWRERSRTNPSGRIVTVDEVAAAICFLASPDASGINGEVIRVALGSAW